MSSTGRQKLHAALYIVGGMILLPALTGFAGGYFGFTPTVTPGTLALSGGLIGWGIWHVRNRRKPAPPPRN